MEAGQRLDCEISAVIVIASICLHSALRLQLLAVAGSEGRVRERPWRSIRLLGREQR